MSIVNLVTINVAINMETPKINLYESLNGIMHN